MHAVILEHLDVIVLDANVLNYILYANQSVISLLIRIIYQTNRLIMKIIFLILLVLIFISSCKQVPQERNEENTIQINPTEALSSVPLSSLVDSIKYVRLKTAEDNPIGSIGEIQIRDKYIYVRTREYAARILVFNHDGDLISELDKRGQGAGEYNLMGAFFVDQDEKYIELIDMRGKSTALKKYSNVDFELVEETPMPDLMYNSCKRINDTYYYSNQQMSNYIADELINASLLVVKGGKIVNTFLPQEVKKGNSSYSPYNESFAFHGDSLLYLSAMFDDTFYRVEGKNISPIITVDFGDYGINNKIIEESIEKQLSYIQTVEDLASFPVLNIYTPEIMALSYYFKQSSEKRMYRDADYRHYIKIPKTDCVYHMNHFENDLTDFPDKIYLCNYFKLCSYQSLYKDYLVSLVIPNGYFSDMESKEINTCIGKVTSDDNPVILMMKLKEEV